MQELVGIPLPWPPRRKEKKKKREEEKVTATKSGVYSGDGAYCMAFGELLLLLLLSSAPAKTAMAGSIA